MSWGITVTLPNENNTVGSVSAVWTDPISELGVFTFSKTARATQAAADTFIARAIAARDEWQVAQAANNAKSAWALDRLNNADPKVV